MQCDEPPCVEACPTGASYTTADGVTLVNYEDCINCGQCVAACPYGARHSNKGGSFFFDSSEPAPYEAEGVQREDVMEKCIFCDALVAEGGLPACVTNCPGSARTFGDIDDPESAVSKKIAAGGKVVGATGFYYIAPAGMPGDMIASKVMVGAAPTATPDDDDKGPAAEPGISPVAIGAGVVVVAAAGVGIGVAAKKNSNKKKAGQDTDKNGGQQ
jgi:Fe-S-cluster-containing dehydrogenase component